MSVTHRLSHAFSISNVLYSAGAITAGYLFKEASSAIPLLHRMAVVEEVAAGSPLAGLLLGMIGMAGFGTAGALVKPEILGLPGVFYTAVCTTMLAGAAATAKWAAPVFGMMGRYWRPEEFLPSALGSMGCAFAVGGLMKVLLNKNAQNPTVSREWKKFDWKEIRSAFGYKWIAPLSLSLATTGIACSITSAFSINGGCSLNFPFAALALLCNQIAQKHIKEGFPIDAKDFYGTWMVGMGRVFLNIGTFLACASAASAFISLHESNFGTIK